jgi:glutamate 5-kinase
MVDLVRQIHMLRSAGAEILLVSSGAIAYGLEVLNFPRLPKEIPQKQMLSAVGQPKLINLWAQLFAIYSLTISQILLTRNDLKTRTGYLNARNTLFALLDQKVIPVINENDTVATEEIRVGDNDNLSALVSNLVDADLLVILTDQKGLFLTDPRKDPQAQFIPLVDGAQISPEIWEAAGDSGELGVGGMVTKLQAADLARRSGSKVVIAQGSSPEILLRIARDEPVGTQFTPTTSAIESRKRYILSSVKVGDLVVDEGAAKAILNGGSLLSVGLTDISGNFERGEIIGVSNLEGREFARGLVNYNNRDCVKLCGKHSREIETLLGYYYGDEIIHRSNLVMV